MPRLLTIPLALATLSVVAYGQSAYAQTTDQAVTPSQPAPIVRSYANAPAGTPGAFYSAPANAPGMQGAPPPQRMPQIKSSRPIAGVWLRAEPNSSVQTVSANADGTEIRVEHGRANVIVQHPAANTQIQVDLPGGQTSLLKDGFYTFNAETNTVRVLRGEAEVYPGADSGANSGANSGATTSGAKPIKLKEDHEVALNAGVNNVRSIEADRNQLAADVLPGGSAGPRAGYGPYGDGFYGGPYYGSPYYAYGYPYGWGYGFGLGFGYYGGFRGGYYGGFRGIRR